MVIVLVIERLLKYTDVYSFIKKRYLALDLFFFFNVVNIKVINYGKYDNFFIYIIIDSLEQFNNYKDEW